VKTTINGKTGHWRAPVGLRLRTHMLAGHSVQAIAVSTPGRFRGSEPKAAIQAGLRRIPNRITSVKDRKPRQSSGRGGKRDFRTKRVVC